ncbi:hypothetical protein B9Z55_027568 [Caenorhabditis nigoni]|uniref:Integrase catalytic domain-containing protein n=1 Tax=Caenorhabditis nigoni TaxID=1611254 RepID=A0A2G5SF53_9PELO|nr:hypothetical protein B9Z55_027568 [Caenorhabditis nigoni]
MSITHDDLNEWNEAILATQNDVITNANYAINNTLKESPTKDKADLRGETAEEYITQYAVLLASEKSDNISRYKDYRTQYDATAQAFGNIPTGNIIAQSAKEMLEKIYQEDKKVKIALGNLQTKLVKRHNQLNEIAEKEKVTKLAEEKYQIVPEQKRTPLKIGTGGNVLPLNSTATNVSSYNTSLNAKNLVSSNHMELPVFYGDIAEWPAFYMPFKKIVADVEGLEDVIKHNILRQHLRGAPYDLVKPYKTDGSEFATALDRLVKMYDSKEKQHAYLWNKLMNIPKAKESASSLRTLHNELLATTNSLKTHGDIEALNYQAIVKSKLPRGILIEILKSEPTKTSEILAALDKMATIEESAFESNKSEREDRSAFSVNSKQSRQQKSCKFCQRKNHNTVECKTIASLSERKEFIKRNNLCFNCMSSNHRSQDCRSTACRKCNVKHNQAICPKNHSHSAQNQYQKSPQNYPKNQNENYRNNFRKPNEGPQSQNQLNGKSQWKGQTNYNKNPQWNGNNQNRTSQWNGKTNGHYNGQNKNEKPQGQSNLNKNTKNSYTVSAYQTSLMVANAPIIIDDSIETIPVLLDSGADQSFILSEFAERLNLKVIEKNLEFNINAFGKDPTTIIVDKVEFEILTNDNTCLKVEALTVPTITDLFDPVSLSLEDREFLESRNQTTINITRPEKAVALLGCDVFWNLMSDQRKEKLPSGRFIISTHIGPVICGKQDENVTSIHALIARINNPSENTFTETSLEEYFKISNIGITDNVEDVTNDEIVEEFKKSVKINENSKRIIVSLPWKEGQKEKLSNNKDVAYCRLKQQYSATSGKEAWKVLKESFETMEKSGIIEQIDNDPNIGFFIPYSQVFNTSSNTTKVRTVFDASSKKRGEISLNNALHQGPSLIPDLQGILLRIRQGKYVLSGDIEKAFHAVEVNNNDRDALRFLWLEDPDKPPSNENIRIMRFTRLPFGVNCSPFLLSMAIIHGANQPGTPPELVKAIEKMCYVDNLFMITDDKSDLPNMYHSLKKFFDSIGMNIREFSANTPHDFVEEKDKAKNLENVKLLGYRYDLSEDTLEVRTQPIENIEKYERKMTKRQVVSEITSVFDPLQIFAPLYLEGKLITRNVSPHTIKWTDAISPEIAKQTIAYRERINNSNLKFRRCIPHLDSATPVRIAVFTDASEHTYGACIYLIVEKEGLQGECQPHLLISKQRIAPQQKTLTIPRLELLGLSIGVKLLNNVLENMELNVKSIEIFSDSTIALTQIKNHSTLKGEKQPVFVENRCRKMWHILQDIKLKNEDIEISFSHVFTDQNPADHITRGFTSEIELKKSNYFGGPIWLGNLNHEDYPSKKENNKLVVPKPTEHFETPLTTTVMVTKTKNFSELENKIIPLAKMNNLVKTKRVTALVLRFLKNRILKKLSIENKKKLISHIPELSSYPETPGKVSLLENEIAEKLLIRIHQLVYEIKENPKENQFLRKNLDDTISDQIVYQHNRTHVLKLKPIINTKSELARLIVRKTHVGNLHIGPSTTLGIVLEKYAGTQWKRTVKKELKRCSLCRKVNNHSFREAPPGLIPERRTNESIVFQHAGVDFIGPIKTQRNSLNEVEKSYIAIFTCTVTRMIHLELVRDVSTDEFLLAFTRFMGRRGCPQTVTSDNAATFKLVAEILDQFSVREDDYLARIELDKIVDQKEKFEKEKTSVIEKEMTKKGVTWYFNTALAPWQGAHYERLVGIVKKALKHALGDHEYRTKDLETIMIECESLVNRRPLTYVDEESEDSKLLRPIDILTPDLCFANIDENGLEKEYYEYTSMYRQVQKHVKRFWNIFHRDYLQQNKNFQTMYQSNRAHSNLVKPIVGEVVLLKDELAPRGKWKIGIISELMKGRDGEIRSVRIRTTLKRKKIDGSPIYKPVPTREITRPLRLVIPLEIRPENATSDENESDQSLGKQKVTVNLIKTNKTPEKPEKPKSNDRFEKKNRGTSIFKMLKFAILLLLSCLVLSSSAQETTNSKPNVINIGVTTVKNRLIKSTTLTTAEPVTELSTIKSLRTTKTTTFLPETSTKATTRSSTLPETTVRTTPRLTTTPETTVRATTKTTTVPTTSRTTTRPTTTETPIRTTTSPSTTASTTEYYSPYTPQWRTPHTTTFWQYDHFFPSTTTFIPEPEIITTVDLPNLTTRSLPKAEGVRRSAQTTTPATTRRTTATTTKRPTTTTKPSTTTEDPTTIEPSTPIEEITTIAPSKTTEDSVNWRIHHPHEKIHPWNIPDMENIFRTITKGIVPILTGLTSIVLMSLLMYLCIVPLVLQCLTRPIGRNRR